MQHKTAKQRFYSKMSQPRTRSQGPPETSEEASEEPMTTSPLATQKRMSQELQVKLEALRLHPVQSCEESETSQTLVRTARPASATLRPPSTIPPALRPSSVMGTFVSREVSTKFNQYHIVSIYNSTAEDGKQNHTTGLVILRNQDSEETDLEVAEIVAGTALIKFVTKNDEDEQCVV